MGRIIIEHEDGRRFSVTPEAHAELYPDFTVVGPETDGAFETVGIPKPKRPRHAPRAKDAAPIAEPEPESEPDAEPEA